MKFSITDMTAEEFQRATAAFGIVNAGNLVVGDDDGGPVNTAAPAVDSSGLPWDERIHSGNKAVTDTGTWRKKRGASDALFAQVSAELRARMPVPVYPAMPTAPDMTGIPQMMPLPTMPMMQPPMPTAPVQFVPPPPMLAPQPPMPVAPPAGPIAGLDFPGFMQMLAGPLQTGALDAGYLAGLVQRVNASAGVQLLAITDLDKHPHLLDWTANIMRSEGKL